MRPFAALHHLIDYRRLERRDKENLVQCTIFSCTYLTGLAQRTPLGRASANILCKSHESRAFLASRAAGKRRADQTEAPCGL